MTTTHSGLAFGYARISTTQQDEALQRDALQAAGVDRIYVDQASGSTASRPALDEMLGQLRAGDTVVIWRLDRLGRSLRHLIDLIAELEDRGVGLRSLTESIDTTPPSSPKPTPTPGTFCWLNRDEPPMTSLPSRCNQAGYGVLLRSRVDTGNVLPRRLTGLETGTLTTG